MSIGLGNCLILQIILTIVKLNIIPYCFAYSIQTVTLHVLNAHNEMYDRRRVSQGV